MLASLPSLPTLQSTHLAPGPTSACSSRACTRQRTSASQAAVAAASSELPSTSQACSAAQTLHGASRGQHVAFSVQHGTPASYWAAADVHCRVFHEEESPAGPSTTASGTPRELLALVPFLNRIDRVACLQALENHSRDGHGKCALLLAYDSPRSASPPAGATASPSTSSPASSDDNTIVFKSFLGQIQGSPLLAPLFASVLHGHPGQGLGVGAEEEGLVGACFVDSFGDLVPARSMEAKRRGAVGWYKRAGIAYISNVATLPSARGQGVARRLVEEAQELAKSWDCRSIGLHCNQKNVPALNLYRSLGYRQTVLEPAIMPYLHMRPPYRCHFYLKRLAPVA